MVQQNEASVTEWILHSRKIKGKRKKLIEKDPHCYFCRKEVAEDDSGLFTVEDPSKSGGRIKVLSCLECIYKHRYPLLSENSKNQKRRQKLIDKDPRCYFCKRPVDLYTSTLDHLIPRSKGGRNTLENLVLSCYVCHYTDSF